MFTIPTNGVVSWKFLVIAVAVAVTATTTLPAADDSSRPNGFDLSNSLISPGEIHQGGPPRDGIPAIDSPVFVTASAAGYLDPDEDILGIVLGDQARAYPVRIMNWHEIVNDHWGERPLLITFCPLCGTGMAFLPAGTGNFGVSGLLYNSDMLLYDRNTGSLWSQLLSQAISGARAGEKLPMAPLELTSWSSWLERYPQTLVLSEDTGHERDYRRDPYQGYADKRTVYFPVARDDPRYHPKERVIGLAEKDAARAWPTSELARSTLPLHDKFAGQPVVVHLDPDNGHAWVTDGQGKLMTAVSSYWFAWINFHPDSSIYCAR